MPSASVGPAADAAPEPAPIVTSPTDTASAPKTATILVFLVSMIHTTVCAVMGSLAGFTMSFVSIPPYPAPPLLVRFWTLRS